MARDDKKEEEEFNKGKEKEIQVVTNEQLINFKLDQILEKLENLEKKEKEQE